MDEKKGINWRMLPKKPAKFVRAKLQQYYKELKEQSPHGDISLNSSFRDPDIMRVERHNRIERGIQVRTSGILAVSIGSTLLLLLRF